MATSQNGWPAGDPAVLDKAFAAAGVTFPGGVRRGDVSTVPGYVATRFHTRVERLGAKTTYSAAQRDEIHRILGEVNGVVGWAATTPAGSTRCTSRST